LPRVYHGIGPYRTFVLHGSVAGSVGLPLGSTPWPAGRCGRPNGPNAARRAHFGRPLAGFVRPPRTNRRGPSESRGDPAVLFASSDAAGSDAAIGDRATGDAARPRGCVPARRVAPREQTGRMRHGGPTLAGRSPVSFAGRERIEDVAPTPDRIRPFCSPPATRPDSTRPDSSDAASLHPASLHPA
jgi:hypothetical protein